MSRVTNFPIITSKLNDIGLDSIEDIHPLDTVCYEGDSKLITASNGISSLKNDEGETFMVDSGTRVTICKNQYIDYKDFDWGKTGNAKTVIRVHFTCNVKGCESNCSCGCCNYRYSIGDETPVCNCTQKPPIDPGKQQCIIS